MYAFAPSAAAVLADWGADVVKVRAARRRRPDARARRSPGCPTATSAWRSCGRSSTAASAASASTSRHADGQQVLHDLVARRRRVHHQPAARARAGASASTSTICRRSTPRLVYARASGHGDRRARARRAAASTHRLLGAHRHRPRREPWSSDEFVPQPGPALGDLTSGAFLAGGIAAALVPARAHRRGARSSTCRCCRRACGCCRRASWRAGCTTSTPSRGSATPKRPTRSSRRTRTARRPPDLPRRASRPSGTSRTSARWSTAPTCSTTPGSRRAKPASPTRPSASRCIDEIFAARTLAEWRAAAAGLSTPWMVVQTAAEASRDPQVVANGLVVDVEGATGTFPLVASPAQFDGAPPSAAPGARPR